MFRAIRRFFTEYKQFGLVLLSVILAVILYVVGFKAAAHIVLIISAILNVIPLIWGMIQDVRMGTYGVDILAATAIMSALLFKEYWAGIVIVFMLTGGEALEDYAEKRAQTELSALLERAPSKAHILRGRKEIDVPVSQVQAGDKLLIKPGEVVPVDAVVVEGHSDVDESSLTGESLPVSKKAGDDLLSGSVTMDGALTVKAVRTSANSQYSQIVKLVQSAQASRPPFVRLADRYSVPFTLLSFTIAFAAWALSGHSIRFLEVLVVATPCPLILGAPIALISGMSRAAKHGIILKNGAALEQLAAAKTIAFDKTGTLTEGRPVVKKVTTYGKLKTDTILGLTAALEQNSSHILARAIVDWAGQGGIKIPKAKKVKEIPGRGLEAQVRGHDVLVGRLSLLKERQVKLPAAFKAAAISSTAALVAIDGELAATISFEDRIRSETKPTLQKLKDLRIKHLLMITGDNRAVAKQVAKQLGIKDVVAEALPIDKLQAVEKVDYKPTAFVGDGVNDAPVLAASDVGVALGARGSTAASESADVVIMTDNLEQVVHGIEISRRTLYIAKQSILVGIGLSVILMLIFATGKFRPVYGAAIQEVVDVVVMINALRAHGSIRRQSGPATVKR